MRLVVILLLAALAAPSALIAQKIPEQSSEARRGSLTLETVDLTPQFLAFHAAALGKDADARFALWQSLYGFAAVPPGPEGDRIARRMLDEAWPRYAAALPMLRTGASRLGTEPLDTLARIAEILAVREPLRIRLRTFVGGFENNAFTQRARDGTPMVNFAIETASDRRPIILPHELTHAVHLHLARMSGGWERTIAATLLMEGLSVHVTREVSPGRPEKDYIEFSEGWWAAARGRQRAILAGILPVVEERKPEMVFRYTMGSGSTGLEREAYAAGYWVVEELRRQGLSLGQIARVEEGDMPALVRRALTGLLARTAPAGPDRTSD